VPEGAQDDRLTEVGRNVPFVSRAHLRVLSLLAALTVGFALPAGAVAQSPQLPGLSEEPPPWPGGEDPGEPEPGGEPPGGEGESGGGEASGEDGSAGSEDDSAEGGGDPSGVDDGADGPAADELPRTGSEPLLLGLSGAALALLGTGLRLRTLDADLF
jgi:hypothetical protein